MGIINNFYSWNKKIVNDKNIEIDTITIHSQLRHNKGAKLM